MNGRRIPVVSTVVAVLLGLTSAWGCPRSYSSVLKANRGFSLPSGCPEIYEKDSGISFNGDGLRYHVFAYREELPVNGMFEWSDQEDRTIFYSSYREAVSEWLDDIGVPSEEYPDGTGYRYWYASHGDFSEIIVLLHEEMKRIYIVESFL